MGVEHTRDELEARLREIDSAVAEAGEVALLWRDGLGITFDRGALWRERCNILTLLQGMPEQDPIRMGEVS